MGTLPPLPPATITDPSTLAWLLAVEGTSSMGFLLTDIHSEHIPLLRLTDYNHTAPSDFIIRRDGQLGYSPLTGQWHTSTYALSSSPSSAITDLHSSLDWCEANYDISIILARSWGLSIWLAEWWNCWSNIPFVLLALWGVYNTRQLPNRYVSGGRVANHTGAHWP